MRTEIHKTEEEWLAARKKGIGASESSIIYGLPGYRSIRRVWADKKNLGWGVFSEDSKDADFEELGEAGHRSEDMNAKWFSDKTGFKVFDPGDYTIQWAENVNAPIFSTIDRFCDDGSPKPVPLELKLAFYEAAKIWMTLVPQAYMIQLQHQILCAESTHCYISVILNGYQHRFYKVDRHERTIDEIKRRCEWFWDHVEKNIEPPVFSSPDMTDTLSDQYPEPVESTIDLPGELWDVTEQIEKDSQEMSIIKKRDTHNKNLLRDAIGDHTTGILIDGETVWNWKKTKRGRMLKKGKLKP